MESQLLLYEYAENIYILYYTVFMVLVNLFIAFHSRQIIESYSFENIIFAFGYLMDTIFFCIVGYFGWDDRLSLTTWIIFLFTASQWILVLLLIHLSLKIFLRISSPLVMHTIWIPISLSLILLCGIICDVTLRTSKPVNHP